MVTESHDTDRADFRFRIRPNRSLSPSVAMLVYGAVGVFALGFALRFAFLGAWMVLPFTVAELLFLAWAAVQVDRKQRQEEVITISGGEVHILWRGAEGTRERRFPDYWAQVVVKRSRVRNHPSRLVLRSHGKEAEVGSFLTEEERLNLARQLKRAIGAHQGHKVAHSQATTVVTNKH